MDNKNDFAQFKKSKFLSLSSAIAISFAITAIIFIGYAILLTYTNLSEKNLSLVITSTIIFSIAIAGFDVAKSSENNGWLWGMLCGLIYASILTVISFFVSGKISFNANSFMLYLLSAASGCVGGIIGINFRK